MAEETVGLSEFVNPDETAKLTFEEEEPSFDFIALLRTLTAGRNTILVTTLVAIAIAAAAAYIVPPEYTSKASFVPPSTSSTSTAAALMGQLSQIPGIGAGSLMGGIKSPGDLYVGILKSRSIADKIIQRFDLQDVYRVKKLSRAEKALSRHSDFEVGLKDSIVTISVEDKSPTRARDIANAYLDELREANGRLALTESSQRRLFFEQQLAKEKDALEDAEVDLKKTEEQTGMIAPAGQTATEIQIIAQTRAQIASREVELSALRDSATPENPEVIRLQSEISDLQGQLARLQSGSGKKGSAAIPTSRVPELELDYVRKTREVKYHEALFDLLSRQYEAARMDESHQPTLLQVLDPASDPDAKSWPNRALFVLGGLILGFLVGSLWVLLRERFYSFYALLASSNIASR